MGYFENWLRTDAQTESFPLLYRLVSKGGGGRGKQFVFEMNDIHSKEEEDLSDGYILDRKRKILKPLYFISVFRFKYQRCTT